MTPSTHATLDGGRDDGVLVVARGGSSTYSWIPADTFRDRGGVIRGLRRRSGLDGNSLDGSRLGRR